jgi:uncharacterized membrane protein
MKPLFILMISFFVAKTVLGIITGEWNFHSGGNIAMFIMLCSTSIAHFIYTKGMEMMIPDFIPFKLGLVYLTGVLEFLFGLGLLFPATQHAAAIALIVFFILVMVANINASVKKVNYIKSDFSGSGVAYLWFRVPLQLFFIAWVWYFGLR